MPTPSKLHPTQMAYWAKRYINILTRATHRMACFDFSKPTFFVTSPREKPPPKSNNVFLIETRRLAESVDGLNSSVKIVAGEL